MKIITVVLHSRPDGLYRVTIKSLWVTIVLCAHSVWRAGGKGKGQRAGNTIESWLSHSEIIIVYLCLHSLWAGARGASLSKMKGRVRGRARDGWVGPPEAD